MKPIWRILLVEDNPEDALLIQRAIEKSNGAEFMFRRVENKEELIEAMENYPFDSIISDVHMPKMTFEDVLRFIKYYKMNEVPLIVVTGALSSEDVSLLLGVNTHYAYISKDNLWQLGPFIKQSMETQEAQFQTIMALVEAIEYRDRDTAVHSTRVIDLTINLAQTMKVNEKKLRELRIGATLHDVGKIGIPDHILNKPGILSKEEFEIMSKHCEYGHQMLENIPSLRQYSDITLYHHERWNGTGYPKKLKGTEIPLSARIFAVVDVFDALTTNRPYRTAWTPEQALKYIESESEEIFDPDVVKAFIKLIHNQKKEKQNETN